jgi:hypothetical protein
MFTFKNYVIAFVLLMGSCATALCSDSAVTISVSKLIAVSTSSVTTVLSADPQAKKTCIMNTSADYLLIGDADTVFSTSATTGTFRLAGTVASTNPNWYCFDGPTAPYKGAIRAQAPGASSAVVISVIREK